MSPENDAAVIADSLDRPERFEVLIERHLPRLLDYLTRRVGREVATDLLADTFEHAFRRRARFVNVNGSALPWLYGIAGNLVRMHRRTETRRLRALAREARSQVAAYDPPVAGALEPELLEALARLTRPLREVLLLHAWGELSNDEIAAALGLTPEAVRTRLHRARKRVAANIGPLDSAPRSIETQNHRHTEAI
jgi:RNA polymerase sigma factor (sigma-70 family)